MGMRPYYEHDGIVIYNGDCREILPTLPKVDLVLTDPPYGIGWSRGARGAYRPNSTAHRGIMGDDDTTVRDEALALIGDTPALVFGSFYAPFPNRTKQVLVYHKPPYSGLIGAVTPFRRDAEPIFLLGSWPKSVPVLSGVLYAANGLNGSGESTGHPHTKPMRVITALVEACDGFRAVLDPFMGSGTTLVACKRLGRKCIGIEIEEKYCEIAARRVEAERLTLFEHVEAKTGDLFERGALGDGTHRMTDDGLRVLGTQDACKEAALESGGKHER